MLKPLRGATQAAGLGLLATAIAAFGLLHIVPGLTNLETRTVLTGSMEPTIAAGSVAFVDTATTSSVEVGDIVLFSSADRPIDVLHRVVDVTEQDGIRILTTQGDANEAEDRDPVREDAVLGTTRLALPYVGFALDAVQGDRTLALLLAGPALLIILMELPLWYRFIRYGRAAFEFEDDGLAPTVAEVDGASLAAQASAS